ncbi:ATP-dependent Clp protease ATP-binding subunit, partial [Enterococcus faecium]
WLKTLYRKRAVTWPFIFYTIIWTLSLFFVFFCVKNEKKHNTSSFY